MKVEDFQRALVQRYTSNTSKYAPFALWKMQKMTGEGEAFYDERNKCMYVIRGKQLLFYASENNDAFHIPVSLLNSLDFIVLNLADLLLIQDKLEGFAISQGCTLYYDFDQGMPCLDPSDFEAVDFDFHNDLHFEMAANLLNTTMGGDSFNPERLKKWAFFPSFDPSLWVWVRDKRTSRFASFGVSTFQKDVRETDLDWIYVLPEYQGQGVGRILIAEIIRRSINRSNVIRVAGIADGFYKKCGFYERELWGYAVKPGFSMNEQ